MAATVTANPTSPTSPTSPTAPTQQKRSAGPNSRLTTHGSHTLCGARSARGLPLACRPSGRWPAAPPAAPGLPSADCRLVGAALAARGADTACRAAAMGTSLSTEVLVDAPADEVWNVLTDFEAYGEWNPTIVSAAVEGRDDPDDMVVGDHLELLVRLPGKSERRERPRVLDVRPGRELRWLSGVCCNGCFDGEHYFVLIEEDDGGGASRQRAVRTRVMHGEYFQGAGLGALWACRESLFTTPTRAGFEAMDAALKRRVEGGAGRRRATQQ